MSLLKRLWEGWKRIAAKIAHVQGHLILGVIYFLILMPIALLFRIFQDPLALRRTKKASYWHPRPSAGPVDAFLKRQY